MDESRQQMEADDAAEGADGPSPHPARPVVLGALIFVAIAVMVVSAATLL